MGMSAVASISQTGKSTVPVLSCLKCRKGSAFHWCSKSLPNALIVPFETQFLCQWFHNKTNRLHIHSNRFGLTVWLTRVLYILPL